MPASAFGDPLAVVGSGLAEAVPVGRALPGCASAVRAAESELVDLGTGSTPVAAFVVGEPRAVAAAVESSVPLPAPTEDEAAAAPL